jgi:hypothetical protein
MSAARLKDLERFYAILDELERRLGGARLLGKCTALMTPPWCNWGVYFFRESGELRSNGRSQRIVRVGTHTSNCPGALWRRLRGHRGTLRGTRPGGGYHRGSRFRLWVGTAILARDGHDCPSWIVGNDDAEAALHFGITKKELLRRELPVEMQVSVVISTMPFLWLPIEDNSGDTDSNARDDIEKQCTRLLSNYYKEPLDAPSEDWLGQHCCRAKVRQSGLWSVEYVDDEPYEPAFLGRLESLVEKVSAAGRTVPVGFFL